MSRLVAMLLLLAPVACSSSGNEVGNIATPASVETARPVEDVRLLEIGRTRDGVMVSAYGIAPGIGYSRPRLEPRRGGRIGTDGFLDFDFVADPPDPGFALPQGQARARILRADRLLGVETVRAAQGLRVHGASGGQQLVF